MLVVVAVLSVLVSLTSVSLRAGKEYSKAVVCAGNLKQITLASHLYLQDNQTLPFGFNDRLIAVPPDGYAGDSAFDWQGWWWFHYFYDALGSDLSLGSPLWCPSRFVLGETVQKNVLCGNYGANFSFLKAFDPFPKEDYQGTPIQPSALNQPARSPLFFDSGYAWTTWHCASGGPITKFPNAQRLGSFYVPGLFVNAGRSLSPDQTEDALGGRHPQQSVNIGFADGHLERKPADLLFVQQDETGGPGYCSLIWSSQF